MAKKGKKQDDKDLYDQHIVDALLKLKMPIVGVDGRKFYLRDSARKEKGVEHIAKKSHRLKVRDIETILSVLKHPKLWCPDPDNKVYRNYYGIRKGDDSNAFLKIVTSPIKGKRNEEEEIVTVFPTKSIKVDK